MDTPKATTKIDRVTVMELEGLTPSAMLPDTALVIQQSFANLEDGSTWEPQILVIADSKKLCFKALETIVPELTESNIMRGHGAYFAIKGGAPYDHEGFIMFVCTEVDGLDAAYSIATFAMHMTKEELTELQEFLMSIWG